MNLVDALFSVARNVTESDIDELNQLHLRAKNESKTYASNQGGIKGLYAKLHKGWLFQLALVFAVPMVTAWFHGYKQRVMNETMGTSNDVEDFDEFDDID